MSTSRPAIVVRRTRSDDFDQIIHLCSAVYPGAPSWSREQLASHLRVFPEGQFVATEGPTGLVVGMAASLVVLWDDYGLATSWRDFTDLGMFTNHDPARGRTLYGAEVMVHPGKQRRGIGKRLYAARAALVRRLGLRRIRAGARLRGYHRYAPTLSPQGYVMGVIQGTLHDPTLSFQLRQGFRVLAVVPEYLRHDPASGGHAAVIEWLNPESGLTDGLDRNNLHINMDINAQPRRPG
jgi:ribosomal protein S18 acetylase RimI-like enzyme